MKILRVLKPRKQAPTVPKRRVHLRPSKVSFPHAELCLPPLHFLLNGAGVEYGIESATGALQFNGEWHWCGVGSQGGSKKGGGGRLVPKTSSKGCSRLIYYQQQVCLVPGQDCAGNEVGPAEPLHDDLSGVRAGCATGDSGTPVKLFVERYGLRIARTLEVVHQKNLLRSGR